jgi:hypothetical protein
MYVGQSDMMTAAEHKRIFLACMYISDALVLYSDVLT